MYVKPVQCSLYTYYGVLTHEGEIANILRNKRLQKEDFYVYIAQAGLNYRKLADEERSKEIIVGKQLDYYPDFVAMQIKHTKDGITMNHLNKTPVKMILDKQEEMKINQKLLELGFFPNSGYYMFQSYCSKIIK
jgi:hypothetical protein